jgi:hydrogenase maturation factor
MEAVAEDQTKRGLMEALVVAAQQARHHILVEQETLLIHHQAKEIMVALERHLVHMVLVAVAVRQQSEATELQLLVVMEAQEQHQPFLDHLLLMVEVGVAG